MPNIVNVEVFEGWAYGLVISSESITAESLEAIIDNLADLTESGETLSLSIGETNIAKLSEETIAIATEKGWIVE